MSSKAKSAVSELFDLLESRYALRVLWALKDGHTQTFRLLQDSVGGVTPNTLNTRLKELRAAGLIERGDLLIGGQIHGGEVDGQCGVVGQTGFDD